MNQLIGFKVIAKLTFFLFLLIHQSSCLDPLYEACASRDCGDGIQITYPFYIKGLQQSYCGYPGFGLSCSSNGDPLLQTAENRFIVRDIYYHNRSVRLLNAAAGSNPTSSGCFPQAILRNLTFDVSRFQLDASLTSNIVLFSNCSNDLSLTEESRRYSVGSCGNDTELVMLSNETNLGIGRGVCGGGDTVEIPVDVGEGEVVDGGNYVEVMRRGFTVRWLAADCKTCESSGGRCGFNEATFNFRCFCADRPHMVSCKSAGGGRKVIVIAVVGGFVGLVLVFSSAIIVYRCRHKRKLFSYFSSRDKAQELEDGSGHGHFGVPVFTYAELEEATKNFAPSEELGDGGFGAVYYGKLRDGREVAVKRLYEHNYKRVQQFMNEVDILTRLRHPNLVLLYGCTSRRSRELLLVYEYIPNGTVADHLHGERADPRSPTLTWHLRMSIAIETASALAYLHASDIIHRDVKTNNILLDLNFCVKVADFGLSRLLPNDVTHVSTAPQGTPGYVDPQYHQCYQLTEKSDVYSFGVVLIELISSMPAVDISRSRDEINLANLAINRIQRCAFEELIDPILGSDTDPEIERMTTSVAELAFRCLQFDSDMRPTMNEVLEVLKEIQKQEADGGVGELKGVKPPPPPSPETEDVMLLKNFPPSPVSVADKWVSNSSISTITPTSSG